MFTNYLGTGSVQWLVGTVAGSKSAAVYVIIRDDMFVTNCNQKSDPFFSPWKRLLHGCEKFLPALAQLFWVALPWS